MSLAEIQFQAAWQEFVGEAPGDQPAREYEFSRTRKWRFDFAWPESLVAVEIDGGAFSRGRHTRGGGFEKDCEKLNAAALDGWRVFRFTPQMLKRDARECIDMVAKAVYLAAPFDSLGIGDVG